MIIKIIFNKSYNWQMVSIKEEVGKLLKSSFIYSIPLTKWVSNPISEDKKQGTIFICIDFYDPNKAFHKDN
jgi:hypothetical protein